MRSSKPPRMGPNPGNIEAIINIGTVLFVAAVVVMVLLRLRGVAQ